MMSRKEFAVFCKQRHDVFCNQKYDGNLPYSKHLEFVVATAHKFRHLLKSNWVDNSPFTLFECIEMACWGHDLIEDARVTYNDIEVKTGKFVADIIYCCTEEKGRNREERHPDKYYLELAKNKAAVFVKLCDIIANVTYSILTDSGMFVKYHKEHLKTREFLYFEEFEPMFGYLERLFSAQNAIASLKAV